MFDLIRGAVQRIRSRVRSSTRSGKKLILHIGRHKTGTSSLQLFLCRNEARLRDAGYVYPRTLRAPIAHHPLARSHNCSVADELAPAELEEFWKELEPAPNVIISSEEFQNACPYSVARDFGFFDVSIVVYLREQVGYFLSAYAQAVKARKVVWTMAEFERAHFRADYYSFLRKWDYAFPENRINARLFDRDALIGGDICSDFLRSSEICGEEALSNFVRIENDNNPSIGGALLEFKRRLNATDFDQHVNTSDMYRILQEMARNCAHYRLAKIIPAELYSNIVSACRNSNKKVSDRWLHTEIAADPNMEFGNQLQLDAERLDKLFDDMAAVNDEVSNALRRRYRDILLCGTPS